MKNELNVDSNTPFIESRKDASLLETIQRKYTNMSARHQYYLLYTIIFVLMLPLVFGVFFINGKSFIWQEDGWTQHYEALIYYARWLRSIIKNVLINHTFEIPSFSFSIGYGSDVISTLSYYVIGDPLAFLSVFVPTKYMAYFYSIMIFVRFYLAGVTFSCWYLYIANNAKLPADSKKSFSKYSVLAGSFVYVFCGFALFGGIRHPYFLNPMIYFPLVVLGVEKILDDKRPFLLIVSVFVSAISNFYFFYMIVILTVLYTVWRLFSIYRKKEIKRIFCMLTKIGCYSLLGVCMSAILFLPTILGFLNSSRSESGYTYDSLYSIADYESGIGSFLSVSTGGHDWTYMGYAAIALIAVILLFIQKEHKNVKVAFLVLLLMTMIPFIGSVMNGFSYVSNRWIWGFSFIIAYIVVLKWRSLFFLTSKEKKILLCTLTGYFAICILFVKSRTIGVMFAVSFVFLIYLIANLFESKGTFSLRTAQFLILICVLANISGNALFMYSQRNSGYVEEFISYDDATTNLNYTEEVALDSVDDSSEFCRYSGSSLTVNSTLYTGLYNTQYYWSLENSNIAQYRSELGLCDQLRAFSYRGLDSRTILSTLANVKYYVQSSNIPYGFSKVASISNYSSVSEYLEVNLGEEYKNVELSAEETEAVNDKITTYTIYENDYFLSFGYTYNSYISRDTYEDLTPLEKQEALLQGCVIEEEEATGTEAEPTFTGCQIDYEISAQSGLTIEDNQITVAESNASMTLTFSGLTNSETYLYITGLDFYGTSPVKRYTELELKLMSALERNELLYSEKYYEQPTSPTISLTAKDTNGTTISKSLTYCTSRYTWYADREDFMITFGYDELARQSITIKFTTIGTYSFDSIQVLCQPMENYAEQVSALGADVLENVDFHYNVTEYATNEVSGTLSLGTPKYLLLTIPYTDGWTAYIDGEEQTLLQANTMYMALYVEAGEHEIILTYQTPGLKVGAIVSGISCIVFLLLLIAFRYHRISATRRSN